MLQITRSSAGPTRLIGRLAAELALHCLVRTRDAFGAPFDCGSSYDRVGLFLVLLRFSRLPVAGGTAVTRPLSVSGLAASIGLPFETARRHVRALEAHGLVVRHAEGVAIAPELVDTAPLAPLATELHDMMVAHIADLHRFGVVLPAGRPEAEYRPGETVVALLDTMAALIERNRAVYGSLLAAIVANTIIIANVRGITFDPVLSPRYARIDTIPPDELRRPIRTSAIARGIRLPYSTAAREVKRLVAAGIVAEQPEGLVVLRAQLGRADLGGNNRIAQLRAVQILQRLKAGGFRFDSPASCYLEGPPALLPL